MEMGSNYMTVEGSSGSSDSINGLKFGQKIYFEDVGIAAPAKSGGGSGSPAGKKAGKGAAAAVQPPRCQVEGCKVDLSGAKAYYSRHKVCGMHSKSPMVIVAGLEQRFCQQCSRFHQLPEFDQGKRSCRRRLAGHNERRRKPPPGSLLSSRLGRLSSSLFGDTAANKSGGFLLDFSSYSRHSGRDAWPGTKVSERVSGNESTPTGKYHHTMWPGNNSEEPPPPSEEMYVQQGSAGGLTSFSIPSGECITGVSTDSTCALSLLSNQTTTWASKTGASISHSTGPHTVTVAHLPPISSSTGGGSGGSSSLWGFKGNEAAIDGGLHLMPPDHHLGLGQISQPLSGGQFHQGDLLMDHIHNGGRHYMESDHSRVYNSAAATGHMHWSL